MHNQTIPLPHGFPKDQSPAQTRASIESAIKLLRQHRPSSWHLVLVTAFTGFNFAPGITLLWQHILQQSGTTTTTTSSSSSERTTKDADEELIRTGAAMREGIVKCIPFIGIPRVLSSIGVLKRAQGQHDAEITRYIQSLRLRDAVKNGAGEMMNRGRALWDDVYAPPKLSAKLRGKIAGFHPDLADLIVQSSYGHAMSPVELVGREDTSAIAVTVLKVEEDVLDQLTSHVFGLLKGGGDQAYVRAIIDVVDGLRSGVLARPAAKL